MTDNPIVPAAIAMLVAFALYRRFRRLFGRQPVQPKRMKLRVGFLLLLGAFLLLRGFLHPQVALAMAGGAVLGAALAWLGLRLTLFDATAEGNFYTPHSGIGIAISLLLLGRLAYRFIIVYPQLQDAHAASGDPFAGLQSNPLTAATFALVIAYYAVYLIGVLRRSAQMTHIVAGDIAPPL
jgi:cytochrome b561